jgi:MFS family permease
VGVAAGVAVCGAVLGGIGFGACIPLSMGLAQRMLPHRTSLASGLMLGGAWAFAFVGPMLAELVQNGLSAKASAPGWLLRFAESLPAGPADALMNGLGLDVAFFATAGTLLLAGVITLALPRDLMLRTHRD